MVGESRFLLGASRRDPDAPGLETQQDHLARSSPRVQRSHCLVFGFHKFIHQHSCDRRALLFLGTEIKVLGFVGFQFSSVMQKTKNGTQSHGHFRDHMKSRDRGHPDPSPPSTPYM